MNTKQLFLMRHAKSSWDEPDLDDHERPLNERGRKAAKRMGRLLREEGYAFDLVLCSTSTRTRQTAERLFAKSAQVPPIEERDDLYHASASQLSGILNQISNSASSVLVIGHNPGFEEFIAQVSQTFVPVPTAALIWIELPIECWRDFGPESLGTLKQVWSPKELDGD